MTSLKHDLDALKKAQEALNLIDSPIRETIRGDIDGVDDVELGIEAMAKALTALFFSEDADGPPPELDEVLAELVENWIPAEAADIAKELAELVQKADYDGLGAVAVKEAEEKRKKLFNHLCDLLSAVEGEIEG